MGYTITFYDLASKKYSLKINGGGTALMGAATTFETQEDSDADMFTPIRCQTGSFRYLGKDDHSTWLNLIPANALSMPVKLERSDIVVWQGYIQPQVFDNEYPGNNTVEHNFPVQCPLSVLNTLDIDADTSVNKGPTMTFGTLLQTYIFNRLTGTTISNYYIQGSKTVTEARLGVRVMWANFLDINSNGTIVSKYTCKQVLEEFCKFFGYTCRMYGTNVYFTQPTENTALFTRFTSLSGSGTEVSRGTFNITGAMIASTDNRESVHPGIGKATVKSDINEVDNLIEIPYDELFDKYNLNETDSTIIVRALDQGDEKAYALIRQPYTNGGTLTYENESVSLSCYSAKFNGNALTENKYCRFFVYDLSEVGEPDTQEIPESKKSFSWTRCIELFRGTEYSGGNTTTMFTITSKQQFVVGGGILYISWKMRQTDAGQYKRMTSDRPATLTAQLKVGDMYWKGTWDVANRQWSASSVWTTTASNFTMYLDNEGPKTTRKLATDAQYDGCGVPVNSTLRGIIEFKIIDVQWWESTYIDISGLHRVGNNGFVPMHDFEIGFVRGVVEEKKHRGNEYTSNGGAFREETNVDLIWASDVHYGPSQDRRMPAGLGYILDSDDMPKEKITSMTNSLVIPEQELARIIAAYGNHTHRMVQLSVRESLVRDANSSSAITPIMLAAGSSGLSDLSGMFPLAVSHNWREDTTTLTLIEI